MHDFITHLVQRKRMTERLDRGVRRGERQRLAHNNTNASHSVPAVAIP